MVLSILASNTHVGTSSLQLFAQRTEGRRSHAHSTYSALHAVLAFLSSPSTVDLVLFLVYGIYLSRLPWT